MKASALYRARAVVENFWPSMPSVPRLLWSGASPAPRRRLHHCGAAATASRHAAPPAPRRDQARRRLPPGLQHRCESRSSTPTPHLSDRPSRSASRRRLPLRGAPCTQLLPARQSQRQPVGVHAAGPDHQLRANFPGARAARSACPPRSGARRNKLGLVGHRENQIRHGGRHQMCCTPTRRQHHSEADIHLQTGRLSRVVPLITVA